MNQRDLRIFFQFVLPSVLSFALSGVYAYRDRYGRRNLLFHQYGGETGETCQGVYGRRIMGSDPFQYPLHIFDLRIQQAAVKLVGSGRGTSVTW